MWAGSAFLVPRSSFLVPFSFSFSFSLFTVGRNCDGPSAERRKFCNLFWPRDEFGLFSGRELAPDVRSPGTCLESHISNNFSSIV